MKLTLANLAYNFDGLIFHKRANARGRMVAGQPKLALILTPAPSAVPRPAKLCRYLRVSSSNRREWMSRNIANLRLSML